MEHGWHGFAHSDAPANKAACPLVYSHTEVILDCAHKTLGAKTFYLVGSDYIWPRTSMKIARKHIENVLKGKVVGEEYYLV